MVGHTTGVERPRDALPNTADNPGPEHTIQAVEGRESKLVTVRIGGVPWRLLVDTGATASLLDYAAVRDRAPTLLGQVRPSPARLRMADGQQMLNHGALELEVGLGPVQTPIKFILTSIGGMDGILGMDVLADMVLDLPAGHLQVRGHQIPLEKKQVCCVRVVESVWIPPYSAAFVSTARPPIADPHLVMEPDWGWCHATSIMCARALLPNTEYPGVYLANPTRDAVWVRANTLIGTWEGVEGPLAIVREEATPPTTGTPDGAHETLVHHTDEEETLRADLPQAAGEETLRADLPDEQGAHQATPGSSEEQLRTSSRLAGVADTHADSGEGTSRAGLPGQAMEGTLRAGFHAVEGTLRAGFHTGQRAGTLPTEDEEQLRACSSPAGKTVRHKTSVDETLRADNHEGQGATDCQDRRQGTLRAGLSQDPAVGRMSQLPAHLQEMTDAEANLTAEQVDQLVSLLDSYQDCFVGGQYGLGSTTLEVHEIPTPDCRPIKQPARIVSFRNRGAVEELVRTQLDQGLIEPSTSPWASPVVLVPKKDGTTRFCVDYRRLNDVTVKDAFPLPWIDVVVDYLAGARYFCTLDAAQGYHQVEVREEDRPKTAFTTGYDLFQYKRMPFGLTNAPATFQRLMQKVLVGLQPSECIAYLDDVLVYGPDFQSVLERLRHVLDRLRSAGLRLKPKKCRLFSPQAEYLGHIISARGIATDPEKVKAVKEWPTPTTVTDVRSFVGFCNYYRQYIPQFAALAEPLIELTRKGVYFEWGDTQQSAFDRLREALCGSPVLAYPREDCEFILDTDASDYAIGGILSQVQDGVERPIAYASQSLNKAQRNYCTTKRELYAVVQFCKRWGHYLKPAEFLLRTDHSSLKWLTNFKDCEGILARWLLVLSGYHFRIEHQPGKLHVTADALSRLRKCPRQECPDCDPPQGKVATVDFSTLQYTQDELLAKQAADGALTEPVAWVKAGRRPSWQEATSTLGPTAFAYWRQFKSLILKDGILHRRTKLPSGEVVEQLCAPAGTRREILHMLHDAATSGHLGMTRTLFRCRQRFWWPYMAQDVQMWVGHCEVCARRGTRPPKQGLLQQEEVCCPGERVSVDIAGPLTESTQGNRFIIVMTDHFTKWTEAVATRDHTAPTVARVLVDVWVSRYGCPLTLHSDQGREFESALFQEVCRLLRVNKTRTCPYRPQSNGQVERHNRTIGNMLCKVLAEVSHSDWDRFLQEVMMAYRTSVHAATGYTPAMMHLGRELVVPLDLMYGRPSAAGPAGDGCAATYAQWQMDKIRLAYEKVRAHLRQAAKASAERYNRDVKTLSFAIGDWVWLYYPPHAHRKLELKYVGPLQVVHKPYPNVYVVRHASTGKCKAVHIQYLKAAKTGDHKPKWMQEDLPPDEELEPMNVEEPEDEDRQKWLGPGCGHPPPVLREYEEPAGSPLDLFSQTPELVEPTPTVRELAPLGPPVPQDGELQDLVPGLSPTTTRSGRRTKLPKKFADFELYCVQ